MRAKFAQSWAKASRANLAGSVGFLLALSTSHVVSAALAIPAQRNVRAPDVYRLCPGAIPRLRALASWLRRHKASLVKARRALFAQ